MKMGLYLFAEYVNVFVASAVMSVIYFGGFNFPFQYELREWLHTAQGFSVDASQNIIAILGVVSVFAKIFSFIFFFMWVRWTLPRFRYDQLMRLGWTILIPLAIFNILLTGGLITTGIIPEIKQWW
jgi:NADH-quinone oxidoreductase subunit H